MNVDIAAGDNHPFVAIMALPTERLSFFDVEKLLKKILEFAPVSEEANLQMLVVCHI